MKINLESSQSNKFFLFLMLCVVSIFVFQFIAMCYDPIRDRSFSYGVREVNGIWRGESCSLKCIPCKSCAMYAATRTNSNAETFSTSMHPPRTVYGREIQRYFGRSLPNKFPTQILSASKTLISNLFFYLSTDFRRFSFFLALLVYSFLGYWMC